MCRTPVSGTFAINQGSHRNGTYLGVSCFFDSSNHATWVYCYCSTCYPKRPSLNTVELEHLRARKTELEQQLALKEAELQRLNKSEVSSYPSSYLSYPSYPAYPSYPTQDFGTAESKGKSEDNLASSGLDYLAMVAMLKRY
jgi:hypothetical protein